jgi:hypothetical protein
MPRVRQRRFLVKTLPIVLLVLTAGSSAGAVAPARQTPLHVGERLSYTLSWGKITAGTAVLEVAGRQHLGGRSVVKLLHTARSNDFVSFFYPVNNRVESLLDEEAMLPAHLSFKRREGKRKNDTEVVFDQNAHLATVTRDGQTETLPVPPDVQDMLSCLYFFRSLPLSAVGETVGIDVYHDKKNYHLELRVEGFERMKSPLGEVETVRVLAIMPFRGLFLNEGNIRVWFTKDPARVPILMRAKVTVGSISATLTSLEAAALTAPPGRTTVGGVQTLSMGTTLDRKKAPGS